MRHVLRHDKRTIESECVIETVCAIDVRHVPYIHAQPNLKRVRIDAAINLCFVKNEQKTKKTADLDRLCCDAIR